MTTTMNTASMEKHIEEKLFEYIFENNDQFDWSVDSIDQLSNAATWAPLVHQFLSTKFSQNIPLNINNTYKFMLSCDPQEYASGDVFASQIVASLFQTDNGNYVCNISRKELMKTILAVQDQLKRPAPKTVAASVASNIESIAQQWQSIIDQATSDTTSPVEVSRALRHCHIRASQLAQSLTKLKERLPAHTHTQPQIKTATVTQASEAAAVVSDSSDSDSDSDSVSDSDSEVEAEVEADDNVMVDAPVDSDSDSSDSSDSESSSDSDSDSDSDDDEQEQEQEQEHDEFVMVDDAKPEVVTSTATAAATPADAASETPAEDPAAVALRAASGALREMTPQTRQLLQRAEQVIASATPVTSRAASPTSSPVLSPASSSHSADSEAASTQTTTGTATMVSTLELERLHRSLHQSAEAVMSTLCKLDALELSTDSPLRSERKALVRSLCSMGDEVEEVKTRLKHLRDAAEAEAKANAEAEAKIAAEAAAAAKAAAVAAKPKPTTAPRPAEAPESAADLRRQQQQRLLQLQRLLGLADSPASSPERTHNHHTQRVPVPAAAAVKQPAQPQRTRAPRTLHEMMFQPRPRSPPVARDEASPEQSPRRPRTAAPRSAHPAYRHPYHTLDDDEERYDQACGRHMYGPAVARGQRMRNGPCSSECCAHPHEMYQEQYHRPVHQQQYHPMYQEQRRYRPAQHEQYRPFGHPMGSFSLF